jgi:hypothetical protein
MLWVTAMLAIRDFRVQDTEFVKKHSTDFEPPDRHHIITDAVVESAGNIVGYGQVKLIAEAIMVLDHTRSARTKSEAMRMLHDRAVFKASLAGFDQLHGIMLDPAYAELMKKHFGYRDSKGKWLVLEV